MTQFSSSCRPRCTLAAVIAAVVIGVLAAFLQITGVIDVTPAFLWVTLGVAVVYLAVLLGFSLLSGRTSAAACTCRAADALLAGLLGTVLFAVILLAVGIVATSVLSAILVALLLFFITLALVSAACLIRCLLRCSD